MGAGLPVLSTLQTLLATGDRVARIEGVLSGTLSYLFNTFAPGQRFSVLVADARRQGFTEPDPRDDLSGTQSSSFECDGGYLRSPSGSAWRAILWRHF